MMQSEPDTVASENSGNMFPVELSKSRRSVEERAALTRTPSFGRVFTDHMVTAVYSDGKGWHSAKIEPIRSFKLSPASMTLHYALEIFEGMKAYRQPDGGAALFGR